MKTEWDELSDVLWKAEHYDNLSKEERKPYVTVHGSSSEVAIEKVKELYERHYRKV